MRGLAKASLACRTVPQSRHSRRWLSNSSQVGRQPTGTRRKRRATVPRRTTRPLWQHAQNSRFLISMSSAQLPEAPRTGGSASGCLGIDGYRDEAAGRRLAPPPLRTRSAEHHCGGRWWVEGWGRRSMRQRLWLGRTYNPSQSARWRPHLSCVFLLLHLPSGLGSFRGGMAAGDIGRPRLAQFAVCVVVAGVGEKLAAIPLCA